MELKTDAQGEFSCPALLKYLYSVTNWVSVIVRMGEKDSKHPFALVLKLGEKESSREVKLKDGATLRLNFFTQLITSLILLGTTNLLALPDKGKEDQSRRKINSLARQK